MTTTSVKELVNAEISEKAKSALKAFKQLSDVANTNGTFEMSLDEINVEIDVVRNKKSPLVEVYCYKLKKTVML